MIIDKLAEIIENARRAWAHAVPAGLTYDAVLDSYAGVRQNARISGSLITADNLQASKTLLAAITAGTSEAPRLIYMDPPFFTKAKYSEKLRLKTKDGSIEEFPLEHFSDKWNSGQDSDDFSDYLISVSARIMAACDLLKDDGVLWLHIDHHAAHYLKVLTDEIFGGSGHLINEVIWQYKSGGSSKRRFARKHDTLLFYAKNPKKYLFTPLEEKSYNRGRKPYRFKGVKEYRDDGGWYTLIGMRDVWQIDMVGRTAHERTGYATQKPENLLERIVRSCTERGDLCADLYGGSGTLAAVADELSRSWLSVDYSPVAALHTERRMAGRGAAFEELTGHDIESAELLKNDVDVPEIVIDVRVSDAMGADRKLVTIEVTGYEPPAGLKSVMISEFIAAMSADVYSEHEIFTPQATVYGDSRLELMLTEEVLRHETKIAVRVIDIFGRHFMIAGELPVRLP
ncbi:MAG: site-specific DNA-methyltransferase [Clostridiales Family XIII bacterium]|jgi:DNA modification methylase|nr:site-specific DNA-methyltransferase [Clostridiales Family XIII bacterium]